MKALFVVEPNFLTAHVGVRRVIIHYIAALEEAGYVVELASPKSGHLILMGVQAGAPGAILDDSSGGLTVVWTDQRARLSDYESVVITTPWVVARGIPDIPGCIGIIYDLVPNLIATGCLRFSNSPGIFQFAREHDIGFRYYLKHARRITCISESTRQDFLDLYGPVRPTVEVTAHIPFDINPLPVQDPPRDRVLLVNALDLRKNLTSIAAMLVQAYAQRPFSLSIVGKERTDMKQVVEFFGKITAAGIPHTWHRDVDDGILLSEYRQASVLLFPSLYEGLGLPVLEAQQEGVPAITTNVSSLPEVNMNPTLSFAVEDVAGITAALVGVLDGTWPCLAGEPLRHAIATRIAAQAPAAAIFAPRAAAGLARAV